MATNGAQVFFGDGAALLTVAEVASSMRVSTMTVYRLIKRGDLAAVRVGHNYRVRRDEVERYLTSRSVHVEGG
jgi:excisionase family DNA binding protein